MRRISYLSLLSNQIWFQAFNKSFIKLFTMPVITRQRSKKKLIILIPLLAVIAILAYYQLLYKSPRVDNGVASLEKIFDQHRSNVTAVRFAPADSLIVTSSVDSTIKIWRRESGEIIREIKQPSGVAYMDLSEDGKYIVTGAYDSLVRLWDMSNGSLLKVFKGHNGTVWVVAISFNNKMVASGGNDGIVNIWDVETGKLLHRLTGHKRIVWSVKFSPDATQLASSSFDFSFKLWNVADGKLVWDNKEHKETVVDLAFSHDGKILASTSDDKTIKLWNVKDQKLIRTMKVAEHVQAVAFSPDDKRLMTGGRDKPQIGEFLQEIFGDSKFNPGVSARLWDVETGALLQTFTKHGNDVQDVAYSHDGKRVATASADKTVELWKLNK
jgi:WD40 repeat protein